MSAYIFDGKEFARQREEGLQLRVEALSTQGKRIHVNTFTFVEDAGSALYTKLKSQAAARVGIEFEPIECSLVDSLDNLTAQIRAASDDANVTGVMVQKPAKSVWEKFKVQKSGLKDEESFTSWWEMLTTAIDPNKDVDCLKVENLENISDFTVQNSSETQESVLPATVKACLSILDNANHVLQVEDKAWREKRVLVIGRSDIVGKPLAQVLHSQFSRVRNVGRECSIHDTQSADILISAVGVPNLIVGDMVVSGAIVIDVGAPAGDVDRTSVEPKAAFLTPVPGGVGPVTVISLMENCVTVAEKIYG